MTQCAMVTSALVLLAACGCRSNRPAPGPVSRPCPPATHVDPTAGWELGVGTAYEAWRGDGRTVHVRAAGENPSSGYETQIALSPDRRFPPGVRLVRKPPAGMAATVMTPFDVCGTIDLDESLTTVRVIDAERQQLVIIGPRR